MSDWEKLKESVAQARLVQWVSVVWIIIAMGAVLASAPAAWGILARYTSSYSVSLKGGEIVLLGWLALVLMLCLPAGLALSYARMEINGFREIARWITDESRTPNRS